MNNTSSEQNKSQHTLIFLTVILAFIGVFFRFDNITLNNFIFYDEGFYLNFNRRLGLLISNYTPKDFKDQLEMIYAFVRVALASGKSLWFMIVDARFFFGLMEMWSFPRVISAISGSLTLVLVYRFAARFYESRRIGLLSVMLLAILPSHVFYSRIGMQEVFSTLLILAGFYFYVFPKKLSYRTFLSAFFFAAAFFANYRLIVMPVCVVFCEIYLSLSSKEKINFRKFLWFMLIFLSCVFGVGAIDMAQNTIVTFSWMFHQVHLGERQYDPVNFLSYPYYLLRLENWVLGFLIWVNVYLLFQKKKRFLLPFFLVCLLMAIFSLPADKAARYLCVATPFIVMSVAYVINYFVEKEGEEVFRAFLILLVIFMMSSMVKKSYSLVSAASDYETSAEYLKSQNKQVKFLSTQKYIHNLYFKDLRAVEEVPRKFSSLIILASQGYQYLVVGPQAYISWTSDQKKFSPRLVGYLEFITSALKPVREYSHFNDDLLERFVFEHNENLLRSIQFLRFNKEKKFGALRIYDLPQILGTTAKAISQSQMNN